MDISPLKLPITIMLMSGTMTGYLQRVESRVFQIRAEMAAEIRDARNVRKWG